MCLLSSSSKFSRVYMEGQNACRVVVELLQVVVMLVLMNLWIRL